jgi:hypothetical protein
MPQNPLEETITPLLMRKLPSLRIPFHRLHTSDPFPTQSDYIVDN